MLRKLVFFAQKGAHLVTFKYDTLLNRTPTYQQALCFSTDPTRGNKFNRTHYCGTLNESNKGQQVNLYGWVHTTRFKNFLVLRDLYGLVQVVFDDEFLKNDENAAILKAINQECVVSVRGLVRARPKGQENQNMKTGSIEIECTHIEIVNNSKAQLPFTQSDFNRPKTEALRLKYRYLDLRYREMQHNLAVRSNFVHKAREFLNGRRFLDIETPTLFRRTPGGAREFIVPTNKAGEFYCLTQSPQQFKQLLMVAGFDRYYQVARCYRDEMTKPDRQPEFTQIDLEMSFVNENDVMDVIEQLLAACWPSKLNLPFNRMKYDDAIRTYGVDKPDVRFDMRINDVKQPFLVGPCGLSKIDSLRKENDEKFCAFAIKIPAEYENELIKFDDIEKAFKMALSEFENKVDKSSFTLLLLKDNSGNHLTKHLSEEFRARLKTSLNSSDGDLNLVLTSKDRAKSLEILGKLRLNVADLIDERKLAATAAAKSRRIRDPSVFEFLWVVDFPLFTRNEETNKLESSHHPFTAPINEHVSRLGESRDLDAITGLHYDLVLNGSEIGGGSIRIHDAQLQRHVIQNILKENTSQLEHLIEALEFGAPPHGGIALGLDRLISILVGASNIRDVIAFPKNSSGRDLMSSSPNSVAKEELDYYHIKCLEESKSK
jgi:aspartyl-tRNA synthetase